MRIHTAWETVTKYCTVIKLDEDVIFTGSDVARNFSDRNADARSICGSESSCFAVVIVWLCVWSLIALIVITDRHVTRHAVLFIVTWPTRMVGRDWSKLSHVVCIRTACQFCCTLFVDYVISLSLSLSLALSLYLSLFLSLSMIIFVTRKSFVVRSLYSFI